MIGRIWKAALSAAPLRLWALLLAGPAITFIWIGFAMVVWRGVWSAELEGERLNWLGVNFTLAGLLVAAVVASLAAVKVKGGVGAATFEIDGDGRDDAPTATKVTVIEEKPE